MENDSIQKIIQNIQGITKELIHSSNEIEALLLTYSTAVEPTTAKQVVDNIYKIEEKESDLLMLRRNLRFFFSNYFNYHFKIFHLKSEQLISFKEDLFFTKNEKQERRKRLESKESIPFINGLTSFYNTGTKEQ